MKENREQLKNETKSDGASVAFQAAEAEAAAEKKRKKIRLLLIVGILGAVLITLVFILIGALSRDSGWREVTVSGDLSESASREFTFMYRMDKKYGGSDYRTVASVYKEASVFAFRVFDVKSPHAEVHGLYELNRSAGKPIVVEEALYRVLQLFQEHDSRLLFMGPVLEHYGNIFSSTDDVLAKDFDPYFDRESAEYLRELCEYLRDENAIRLELSGSNTVKLEISAELADFGTEYGISTWIDLGWLKNAFILDYLAEEIRKTGYVSGYLLSDDGLVACLDGSDEAYGFDLDDRIDATVQGCATVGYQGPMIVAVLRDYTLKTDPFLEFYYGYEDATFATAFVDPADGLYKAAVSDLYVFSRTLGAGEAMMLSARFFIADEIDEEALRGLRSKDTAVVYVKDGKIYYNGDLFQFTGIDEHYKAVRTD